MCPLAPCRDDSPCARDHLNQLIELRCRQRPYYRIEFTEFREMREFEENDFVRAAALQKLLDIVQRRLQRLPQRAPLGAKLFRVMG